MNVTGVKLSVFGATPLKQISSQQKNQSEFVSVGLMQQSLPEVPSKLALSQMPNVSFGKKYKYGSDDFDAYDNYRGSRPPEIELQKYQISVKVQDDIDNEDYLSAIKGKIKLAEICQTQEKSEDAYYLEDSIRRLYKDLPRYQKSAAKDAISQYNKDMAKYIDEDIKRY